MRKFVGYACAAAILLAAALFHVPCLVVRNEKQVEVASYALWGGQAGFDVSFIHSVSREPAIDCFRKGPDNRIVLYRTAYQGLGAGLPSGTEGGTVSLRDGWIVLEGIHREFSSITYLPLPLTENQLHVRGRAVDLCTLAGGSKKIVFSIYSRPLAQVILTEIGPGRKS